MHPDEVAYYRQRAFIERRRASESAVRLAADIHLKLACYYDKIIELEELRAPAVRVVAIGLPPESGASLTSARELESLSV
jgi:hypothetical protein